MNNGVKRYASESQLDWELLKNKPFYEKSIRTAELFNDLMWLQSNEEDPTMCAGALSLTLNGDSENVLTEGRTYEVVYNGVTYSNLTYFEFGIYYDDLNITGYYPAIGAKTIESMKSGNDYPFIIVYNSDYDVYVFYGVGVGTVQDGDTMPLEVYLTTNTLKTLDQKFLPDSVKIHDWNTLENRPFGEYYEVGKVVIENAVISSNSGEIYDNEHYAYVHSEMLEFVENSTYEVMYDDTAYIVNCTLADGIPAFADGAPMLGEFASDGSPLFDKYPFTMVYADTYNMLQIATQDTTPTEHSIRITSVTEKVKHLDPKYIKDMYYDYIETKEVTLTYDGVLENHEHVEYSVTPLAAAINKYYIVKLSDEVPTDVSAFLGATCVVMMFGDEESIVIDQENIGQMSEDAYSIGNFMVAFKDTYIDALNVTITKGMHCAHIEQYNPITGEKTEDVIYSKQLTYTGDFKVIKELDDRFIPNTIARVAELPEGFSGSWNDLEDKPFGDFVETEEIILAYDGVLENHEHFEFGDSYDDSKRYCVKISDEVPKDITQFLGGNSVKIVNDEEVVLSITMDMINAGKINDDAYTIDCYLIVFNETYISMMNKTLSMGIYAVHMVEIDANGEILGTLSCAKELTYIDNFEVVKKLDDRFQHQSDWNVNDESSAAFIENRTHWIEKDVTILPETTLSREALAVYMDLFLPEQGKTYNVTWDGVHYECECKRNVDGCVYIGNISIYDDNYENTGEPFCLRIATYYGAFYYHSLHMSESGNHTLSIDEMFTGEITANSSSLSLPIVAGNTYDVVWDGATYTVEAKSDDYYGAYIGNLNLMAAVNNSQADDTGEPFYFDGRANIATIEGQHTFSVSGLIPERTQTFLPLEMPNLSFETNFNLVRDNKYKVVFDDVEYEVICTQDGMGNEHILYMTSENTGEPFYIYLWNDNTPELFMHAGSHTLQIMEDKYHTIDMNYLPPLVGKMSENGGEIFNDYFDNIASGEYSHAEGKSTEASGTYSHAEGIQTTASGWASHAEGAWTEASGDDSHAEGYSTTASGEDSHAEGTNTTASGNYSHAEGGGTTASGDWSHAEGNMTTASGKYQHVQGSHNIEDTENKYVHIVGNGDYGSHTGYEHIYSNAHTLDWDGNAWFAGDVYVGGTSQDDAVKLGEKDWNCNDEASAAYIANRPFYTGDPVETFIVEETTFELVDGMGQLTSTHPLEVGQEYTVTLDGAIYNCTCKLFEEMGAPYIGNLSLVGIDEDTGESFFIAPMQLPTDLNFVIMINSDIAEHTVSIVCMISEIHQIDDKYIPNTVKVGKKVEGQVFTITNDDETQTEVTAGVGAEVFNNYKEDSGISTYILERVQDINIATGDYSHAEGYGTTASGNYSHAEGYGTTASGYSSHVEGGHTTASGQFSHAEGSTTTVSGDYSHAEGSVTTASGDNSHAEGYNTTASGNNSHAQGSSTTASGWYSHAEGYGTTASGNDSHAEGLRTIAAGEEQHVQGKYNIEDTANKYAHIVGNGTAHNKRSNAHTVDWNGNAWYQGSVEATAIILKSPNGTRFSITIGDDGVLTASEITE